MSSKGFGNHQFLYKYIRENPIKKIMEIGVADGENARKMIQAAKESFPPEEVEYYGFDNFDETMGNKKNEVESKISKTGCDLNLFEGNSTKVLPGVFDDLPKMDFIFIDGGHEAEIVKSDWHCSKKLMKNETSVFLHNYDKSAVKNLADNINRKKYSVKILDPPSDFKTVQVKKQ